MIHLFMRYFMPVSSFYTVIAILVMASCSQPDKQRVENNPGRELEILDSSSIIFNLKHAIHLMDSDKILDSVKSLENHLETGRPSLDFTKWLAIGYFNLSMIQSSDPNERNDIQKYQSKSISHLKSVLHSDPQDTSSHAMITVLYGMNIKKNPLKSISLGTKLLKHRKLARHGIHTDPIVGSLEGISHLKRHDSHAKNQEALGLLLESERLFKSQIKSNDLAIHWGQSMNQLFIAEAYERLHEYEKAIEYYSVVLKDNFNLDRASKGLMRCKTKTEKKS